MSTMPVAMVVTADWESRRMMQNALQTEYEVMAFENGADMLEMLYRISQRIRFIVIDYNEQMTPTQQGVADWIRAILKVTPIPDICVMCDSRDTPIIQLAYLSGATTCLLRPISPDELRQVGQSCLRDTESNFKLIQAILSMIPDHPEILQDSFVTPANHPHPIDLAYWLTPFFSKPKGSVLILDPAPSCTSTIELHQFLQSQSYSALLAHTLQMAEMACRSSVIDLLIINTHHPQLPLILESMVPYIPYSSILFWGTQLDPVPFIAHANRHAIPCLFGPFDPDQVVSTIRYLFQYRSLLFLLSDRLYRRQLMETALPFPTRIHFLQRFVDAAMLKNQLIYFSDLLHYIPELYGIDNPPNHPIDQSDLSDGVMVYVYELQATL